MFSKAKILLTAAVASALLVCSLPSFANDSSIAAASTDSGLTPWMVRLRTIFIEPDLNSSSFAVIGDVNHVSSQVVPELDISYFFNSNISAELILATSRHNVAAGNVDLGHVYLLPPTVTLQYHFFPNQMIRPYVGAGINYTYFYDANSGPVASSIHYSDSFGPALQAGVDVFLNQHWALNLDVKKLFVETDVHANVPGVTTPLEGDVKLNPWVFGVGIGYRF